MQDGEAGECEPWATFGVSTGKIIDRYDEEVLNVTGKEPFTIPVTKCLQHPLFRRSCYKDRASYSGSDLSLVQLSKDQTPQTIKDETLILANNTGNWAVNYLCSSTVMEGHEETAPENKEMVLISLPMFRKYGNPKDASKTSKTLATTRNPELESSSGSSVEEMSSSPVATTSKRDGSSSSSKGGRVIMQLINITMSSPEECRKIYPDFDTETLMCVVKPKDRSADPLSIACLVS